MMRARSAPCFGSKLAVNEHYAYLQMKDFMKMPDYMTERSYRLAAFALTGFANFASVGIQLGGIAPSPRAGVTIWPGWAAGLLSAS